MSTILFVVTSAHTWTLLDGTSHPTGYWAEEVLTPYRILTNAGHDVTFSTPGGIVPVPDVASLGEWDADALEEIPGLAAPTALSDVEFEAFDAVYYPGGHGPMEDLATDRDSAALIAATVAADRPLAVVCHGLAALLPVRTVTGQPIVSGRRLTCFSDAEERIGGLADRAPFLVESSLRALGALVSTAAPWNDHVVIDGNLITGQNPQSSASAAHALLAVLSPRQRRRRR